MSVGKESFLSQIFSTKAVFFADQTPTPTRFLKNCEEVGLFNELASSFEQEFCKAQEDERTKHPVRIQIYMLKQWYNVSTSCKIKNCDIFYLI